jgi:hypothetical protein
MVRPSTIKKAAAAKVSTPRTSRSLSAKLGRVEIQTRSLDNSISKRIGIPDSSEPLRISFPS